MALNGVTWPVGNPKTLRVSFSTEEQMTKYKAVRLDKCFLLKYEVHCCLFRIRMESSNPHRTDRGRGSRRG